jgi:hypothetical protein
MKVTKSDKHSNLLWHIFHNGREKFIVQARLGGWLISEWSFIMGYTWVFSNLARNEDGSDKHSTLLHTFQN